MTLPSKPKIPHFFWAASGSIDGSNPHFPSASQPPTDWFNLGYNSNNQPSALWTNAAWRTVADYNRETEVANEKIQEFINNQTQFLSTSINNPEQSKAVARTLDYNQQQFFSHMGNSIEVGNPGIKSFGQAGGLLLPPIRRVRIPRRHIVAFGYRSLIGTGTQIIAEYGGRFANSNNVVNSAGQNWGTNQVVRFNLDTLQDGFSDAEDYGVIAQFQPASITYYAHRARVQNKDAKGFYIAVCDPVSGVALPLNVGTLYGHLSVAVVSRKGL